MITIELLRHLCNNNNVIWTAHVLERLQQRGIFRRDVRNAILTGDIIEQYPEDYPYPSCLILGTMLNGQNLHVVCGVNSEHIFIITAYYPNLDKFEDDYKTRKGRL